jgi:hypothetical protein
MKSRKLKFGGILHPLEKEFRTSHEDAIVIPEQKKKTPEKPFTTEHQTIVSRTTGLPHEISFGPNNGKVPANPFKSVAQQHYMFAHPNVLGKKALHEWASKTDYSKLPKKKGKK